MNLTTPTGIWGADHLVLAAAYNPLPLFIPAIALALGACICGWVAIDQIRVSKGRLRGLGLAVFDALLFPLLALGALLAWAMMALFHVLVRPDPTFGPGEYMAYKQGWYAMIVVVCLVVDFFIVRWAWRAVRKPIGQTPNATPPTPALAPEVAATQIERARQAVKAPAIGMIVWYALASLAALAATVFCVVKIVHAAKALAASHAMRDPVTIPDISQYTIGACIAVVVCATSAWMLLAAWRMLKLESRSLAITSAILLILQSLLLASGAVVPAIGALLGLTGLVFGIWALVVLLRRTTRDAFAEAAKHTPGKEAGHAHRQHMAPAIRTIVIHALLLAGVVLFLRLAMPAIESVFADTAMRLPMPTRIVCRLSYASGLLLLLLPVALAIDVGMVLLLHFLAGSFWRRLWSNTVTIVLLAAAILMFLAAAIPLAELFQLLGDTLPATSPREHMVLGPVIERVVNHTGENCLIDLDTGTLTTLPKEVAEAGSKTAIEWARKNGIDAGGGTQPEVQGLIGFDIIALPVDNKVWNLSGDAGLMADKQTAFSLSTPGNPVFLSAKGGVPATYKFQTREGGLGVLQIVGFTDNPKGTKIRYKMLQAVTPGPERP